MTYLSPEEERVLRRLVSDRDAHPDIEDAWSWECCRASTAQIHDDMAWMDQWIRNRAEMGLSTEVPQRLLEYLRVFLHREIQDRYPPQREEEFYRDE